MRRGCVTLLLLSFRLRSDTESAEHKEEAGNDEEAGSEVDGDSKKKKKSGLGNFLAAVKKNVGGSKKAKEEKVSGEILDLKIW